MRGVAIAPRDERITDLLARIDLEVLVEGYAGAPRRRGGATTTFHCPHPAHDDRRPSFTVSRSGDRQRFRCWSACGVTGDAIDLLKWLEGCTTSEAIDR